MSVSVSDPPYKDGNAQFATVTLKPYSEKNVEAIVVFLTPKFLVLIVSPLLLKSKKCASHFCRKTANENEQFYVTKTWIFNSYMIRLKMGIVLTNVTFENE